LPSDVRECATLMVKGQGGQNRSGRRAMVAAATPGSGR
jgi:hypothetical protein